MINLFIDTSYKALVLGLLKDDTIIDQIQIMSEFNFSEIMLPQLDKLLRKNDLKPNEIKKIFVVVGPGSFTGIRIGLTAAKILAQVLDIKIIPLSSLEFMATTDVETKYLISVIDARHVMVFGGIYNRNGDCICEDKYCQLDELINTARDSYTIVTYDNNTISDSIIPKYNIEKITELKLIGNGEQDQTAKDGNIASDQLKGTVIGSMYGWKGNADVGAKAAFDGDINTFFDPPEKGEGYCGLDFGDEYYIISEVKVYSRKDWESRLDGAVIQGSNDGKNWTTLYQFSGNGNNQTGITAVITDSKAYSKVRYYNEKNHGDVAEIEVYGKKLKQ